MHFCTSTDITCIFKYLLSMLYYSNLKEKYKILEIIRVSVLPEFYLMGKFNLVAPMFVRVYILLFSNLQNMIMELCVFVSFRP